MHTIKMNGITLELLPRDRHGSSVLKLRDGSKTSEVINTDGDVRAVAVHLIGLASALLRQHGYDFNIRAKLVQILYELEEL